MPVSVSSPASESVKGVAKIATQDEVNSGIDDSTIVTPLKLSQIVKKSVKIATPEEVISGQDDTHFITPAKLKPVIDSITGGRNRIINGSFAVDQRYNGNPKTITSSYEYCIDRWKASAREANVTGQRVPSLAGGYAYRFTGAQGNTHITFQQRIESANCLDLVNQKCQLSFTAYSHLETTVECQIETAVARMPGLLALILPLSKFESIQRQKDITSHLQQDQRLQTD